MRRQPSKTIWQLVAIDTTFTPTNDERLALLRHDLTTNQDIPRVALPEPFSLCGPRPHHRLPECRCAPYRALLGLGERPATGASPGPCPRA